MKPRQTFFRAVRYGNAATRGQDGQWRDRGSARKTDGSIVGGIRRPLAVGDVVRIPPRIPHQVLLNGSSEFDYFVVKIKGF